MSQVVLWVVWKGGRFYLGASDARERPPKNVQVITVTDSIDKNMMLEWCRKKIELGWTLEQLRAACEVS